MSFIKTTKMTLKKGLHVGIILDGNRRFAKKTGIAKMLGHRRGADNVEKLIDWLSEVGIKELTLYCFSMQNFQRPKEEIAYLMSLFKEFFKKIKNDSRIEKNKIKINFIGRPNLFDKDLQKEMSELMNKTENYKNLKINFAFGYGGREEIIDAVKKIASDVKECRRNVEDINSDLFSQYCYLSSEPDFIIRTGGEFRTSNFLMWQSPYSEWFFLEKTWPEFEKADLVRCVEEFRNRDRRFGK